MNDMSARAASSSASRVEPNQKFVERTGKSNRHLHVCFVLFFT